MKKVLLSLLAVAALVLSCQNYDDEFDALNSKIASLESQIQSLADLKTAVTGVQSSVSSLSAAVAAAKASADAATAAAAAAADAAEAAGDASAEAAAAAASAAAANAAAIADLASDIAAIAADLVALDTAVASASSAEDLAALKSELNTSLAALQALIEANSATIATLVTNDASLKAQLDALGIDVDAILAQNSTYTGNISMTNAAEVNFARSLGDKVAVINGNVNIEISTANGVSAADVSLVTKLITTVVGNVTITTNASIDMSALTSVSGDYVVDGKDISDDALASAGDILLDYDGGYSMPALTTAKKIYLVDYNTAAAAGAVPAVTGTLAVDFVKLTSATAISTAANGAVGENQPHSSGGSIAVGAYVLNTVDFTDATSIKIGDVPVIAINAPDALAIEHHFDGTATAGLASLAISAPKATSVVSKVIKSGAITVDVAATGSLNFMNLATAAAITTDAATVSAAKLATATDVVLTGVTTLSLPAATAVTSVTAALATSFSADALKTATTLSLSKVSSVSLPAATSITTISAPLATSVSAPLAAVTTVDMDETGTAVSAVDLTLVGATSLNVASVTNITDAATITTVTLNSQVATYDVTQLVKATSITYKGKTSAVDFASTAANAVLASLTLGGKLGDVSVSANPKLTSVSTSGTMQTLTVENNVLLATLSLGHTEDTSTGTQFTLDNNAVLTTFTTSFDRVTRFVVTDNAKLASFDASSMTMAPNNAAAADNYSITVTGNYSIAVAAASTTGLKGTYTGLTATTDEGFVQSSLATLKPYILMGYGAAKKFTAVVDMDYVVTSSNIALGANKALAAVADDLDNINSAADVAILTAQ